MSWFWRFGPALIIMAIIFLASAVPGSEMPSFGIWDTLIKKSGHFLGFALLAAAFCHALIGSRKASLTHFLIAFILTALYAVLDEWHQQYVTGRTPSLRDMGIDSIGGLISLVLFFIVRMQRKALPPAQI